MGALLQDLRYGLRVLAKSPGFTLVAVITLALGVGANSAIFSIVNAVLLRPLAYPPKNPERVLVLAEKSTDGRRVSVAYPDFADWRDQNRVFEDLAGYRFATFNLTGPDEPIRVQAWMASASFFSIFGVKPILGRLFTAEEDRPGGPAVAILNYPMWQNRFGADPKIIGKTLNLNGRSYTAIGVLPREFDLIPQELLYVPLEPWAADASVRNRARHMGLWVIGLLKSDVRLPQARAEMETIAKRLEQQYASTNSGYGVILTPLFELQMSGYQTVLLVLLGAVGFVLLIACVNVANLLLARASGRQREIAIRSALGAGRSRLVRQFLSESVLLALLGGSLGLALGWWGLHLVRTILPANVPRLNQIHMDLQVLTYTLGISLLTGILFGLAPVFATTRLELTASLKEGGRGSSPSAGKRLRSVLLASEIALAFVLLTGTGLMIRSIFQLRQLDPGFNPQNVLVMEMALTDTKYSTNQRLAFCERALSQVQSLPGVRSAALTSTLPIMPPNLGAVFLIDGRPVPPRASLPVTMLNPISADYFQAMGVRVLKGRAFLASDNQQSPPVAIIGESLARRAWPNEDPIGKRIKLGPPESPRPWREVVGVVSDVKQNGLDSEAQLQTYLPLPQEPQSYLRLAVRTSTNPLGLAPAVRAEIHSLDKSLPVYGVSTMEQYVTGWMAPRRFALVLLGIFAGLALLLASVGIYGVMAYSVAQRTQEIGVRMALGAQRRDVLKMMLKQALGLTTIGLALGVAGAIAVTRVMNRLLFRVGSSDPATFAGVSLVLAIVALVACYLPARRATRVDPIIALRVE